jgi:hypothetical protein
MHAIHGNGPINNVNNSANQSYKSIVQQVVDRNWLEEVASSSSRLGIEQQTLAERTGRGRPLPADAGATSCKRIRLLAPSMVFGGGGNPSNPILGKHNVSFHCGRMNAERALGEPSGEPSQLGMDGGKPQEQGQLLGNSSSHQKLLKSTPPSAQPFLYTAQGSRTTQRPKRKRHQTKANWDKRQQGRNKHVDIIKARGTSNNGMSEVRGTHC